MGCWNMSKMELLIPKEDDKLKQKQKCIQFWLTPWNYNNEQKLFCFDKIEIKRVRSGIKWYQNYCENTLFQYWFHTDTSTVIGMDASAVFFISIATLGSILDSQLSCKSGKFQLARWSHEVVLYPDLDHPHTHTPHPQLSFFFLCCAVSPPQLFLPSTKYVRCPPSHLSMLCGVPTPCVTLVNKVCAVSPPPSIHFFCAVSPPM